MSTMDILRELSKIEGFSVCHFEDITFAKPKHHMYIAFAISNECSYFFNLITSKPHYLLNLYKDDHEALNSFIQVEPHEFPDVLSMPSYIDCNNNSPWDLSDINKKINKNGNFHVKDRIKIPDALKQRIKEAIINSPHTSEEMKLNLPK